MKNTETTEYAQVPMRSVGPVKLTGPEVTGDFMIPLATYESPLWPSVNRGARVSMQSDGLQAVVVDDRMTRSIVVQAPSAQRATEIANELRDRHDVLAQKVEETSRFALFLDLHTQIVGDLLYIRFEIQSGDAAGHNMVTGAADHLLEWLRAEYPDLTYVSISGNYCTDKKPSAVNGILGRGRSVVIEGLVPEATCRKYLKTSPDRIVQLNIKKNWIGTTLAGSVRTANAHFANMLLAFYLAVGQDAANIVEGSQGFTYAEQRDGDLYFSITAPHMIVGTVGAGKGLGFVQQNLDNLGCLEERKPGMNARRLAVIGAAAIWCGELSLLAAQTNPGELMQAHRKLERGQ